MNASNRADKLMLTPMKDVPAPAIAYAKYLGKKYGMCGEVFVTAFAHYAECFEGAEKSDDSLYAANDEARAFFAGYWAATETPLPKGWQLAIDHYEQALKASWPEGAKGEAFTHWNEARKAMLAAAPKYKESEK